MTTATRALTRSTIIAAAAALAACGGSGDSGTTGFLSLGVSDGPVHEATKVCITFDEVELKGEGAPMLVTLATPQKVNLLDVQGTDAAPILLDYEVPAGEYQWLRLGVDAELGAMGGAGDTGGADCDGTGSYLVREDGAVYNLYVPSGSQNGLKLIRGITVPVNGAASFTAEFDLARSLTDPPGLDPDVVLKPVIRLVNNIEVGSLQGEVADELAGAEGCDASVYLFDDGVTPNPIDDAEIADPNDPVATAMVHQEMQNDGSMPWLYEIGFLLPGDYEAAFTCDGESFEPADGLGTTISANATSTVDFAAPIAE